MSVFRNDARKERSRMSAADVAAMGDPSVTQPMADERADAAAHAPPRRAAARDAEVEDAVVVTPERRNGPPQPAAKDSAERRPLLVDAAVTQDLRTRWDATQIGFVDDPRQSVCQADELVADVIESLAQTLTDERKQLATQMTETASTENLRVALQRYRSFFQRLLSI